MERGILLMGYDTLVNGEYLTKSLNKISTAIQAKSNAFGLINFDDFAARILALPEDALNGLLHGTLTEYVNATPTAIPADLFKGQDKLQKIDMASVKSVGNNAFRECSALVEVNLPVLETLGSAAFIYCTALAEVKFPAMLRSGVTANALRYCSALKKVDFGEIDTAKGLVGYCLADCNVLEMLVIRNTDQPPKLAATAFNNTPIKTGTGYIYVPSAMVDAYKSATNWSAYADQIRAIEDYPEITGGGGV